MRAADRRGLLSPMPNETASLGGSQRERESQGERRTEREREREITDESGGSWEETLAELRLTNPRYVGKSGVLSAECALRGDDGEVRLSMERFAKELLSRQTRLEHELHRAEAAPARDRFYTATSRHTWLQILDLSSNCIVRIQLRPFAMDSLVDTVL